MNRGLSLHRSTVDGAASLPPTGYEGAPRSKKTSYGELDIPEDQRVTIDSNSELVDVERNRGGFVGSERIQRVGVDVVVQDDVR